MIKLKASGNIELNGSSNGGMIKITELTTAINELVSMYNSHTHTANNTPTVMLQTPLVASVYENEKVVH